MKIPEHQNLCKTATFKSELNKNLYLYILMQETCQLWNNRTNQRYHSYFIRFDDYGRGHVYYEDYSLLSRHRNNIPNNWWNSYILFDM